MAKTVTKRKAKPSSKVAQKPNPTLSRTNKRSAKEMQEWYEKNKNTIETFKKAQEALDLLQVQNPTKSATKAFSTFTKENLRTYLENPFSNSKNLRNLSKYLYYRSQVYRRLIQYNANMINLQYRSVIPPFNITEDNDPQTVLQSYADTLSLLEKMNLNLAFKPACITAFREDVFFGCAYLDDTGFFILPIDPDYCKMLVATVPLISGSDDVDDFAVDLKTAAIYFNLIKDALPNYTTALLSPIPIKDIQFNGDQTSDVNKVENATKSVLNISGGAQVLNSSSIDGTTAWNGAIRSDEDMALSSLLPQIQTIVNRLVSTQLSNPSKIKFIGVTTYTVDAFRDSVIKACTYGVPNKLLIGTLNGFSELDTLSMAYLENDILQLPQKFIPLQSSNTQDTSQINGDSQTLTTDGEKSIDKRDKAKG